MTYQKEQERWTELTTQRTGRLRNLAGLTLSKAGWEPNDIADILGMTRVDVQLLIEYSKLPARIHQESTARQKQLTALADLTAASPRKTKRRAKRRRKS